MNEQVDYLVIGHISQDIDPNGYQMGGTVSFSGRTAQALGCRTAIVTSVTAEVDIVHSLPNITVRNVLASENTTFENTYTPAGRTQTIFSVAETLMPAHVPVAWETASIVHLAPVADEVDPAMIHLFPHSMIGLTPQGWLRRWDEKGHIHPQEWSAAATILPLASAVILSEEDLFNSQMLVQYRAWCDLLILTEGESGCTVFWQDEVRQLPAPQVNAAYLTGAGDVFAAAFLVRWQQMKQTQPESEPWAAAMYANYIAAHSLTQPDLAHKAQHIAQIADEALTWKIESC